MRPLLVALVVASAFTAMALSLPDVPRRRSLPLLVEVADVKTCGCPVSATCGDCCGKDDCRCAPTLRRRAR